MCRILPRYEIRIEAGDDRLPSNLRFSRAPTRVTLISQERGLQKTNDLERTGRGVGWKRKFGGGSSTASGRDISRSMAFKM
jgi:hypothetical protein